MEVNLLFFKEKKVTALMGTPGERGGGDGGSGKKPGLWRRFGKSLKRRRRRCDWILSYGVTGGRRRWGGEKFELSRGLKMKMMINEEKSVFK
ncbi:hypothetical protein TIFTF001_022445 [Ficus carica]|uniref:Uncharacterized protein n=1 Tax=Ficus carica TaxID=3494 RepID=A0AA88ATK8_FICCA|nr:hypothetical protein TIFTF001_022445 [Ficus carica]